MKNTWKKSDLIDGAIFRKVDEFVEVYMARPYSTVYMGYPVFHGLISFDEVELDDVMKSFDCKSVAELEKELGADWERKAALVWFDMVCQNDETYIVCQKASCDYAKSVRLMYRMAGYQEDEEELEISRTLTISTVHISQETARLMDMDAISMGFYSKGESGYHILTVGLENYAGDMPEDMKACVKFAADNNCDWLCLDADGQEVKGLSTYQWD